MVGAVWLPSLSRVKPAAKPVPVDAAANGTGADQIVVPPAQVVYAPLLRTTPPPVAGQGAEAAAGVVNFKRFRKVRRARGFALESTHPAHCTAVSLPRMLIGRSARWQSGRWCLPNRRSGWHPWRRRPPRPPARHPPLAAATPKAPRPPRRCPVPRPRPPPRPQPRPPHGPSRACSVARRSARRTRLLDEDRALSCRNMYRPCTAAKVFACR